MGTIKRSVKQIMITVMKVSGNEMSLKDLSTAVNSEREDVHPSHVRGVLNRDIKLGSKTFTRTSRGRYILTPIMTDSTIGSTENN